MCLYFSETSWFHFKILLPPKHISKKSERWTQHVMNKRDSDGSERTLLQRGCRKDVVVA